MSDFEQIAFGSDDDFTRNPEPRCPCLLLLDTSHSMQGQPISELNRGIVAFKDELAADALAMKRVEIAVVTFGPVDIDSGFQTPDYWQPANFSTTGDTPMGQAIEQGLEMIRERKQRYKDNGISYYRPWIFLITDGAPTDSWHHAAQRVREGEKNNEFSFFAIGVGNADMGILAQIAPRGPLKLDGLKFRELFMWLSSSLSRVSASNTGERVALPPPTGWTEV
ncbi:vWA domain-containing protein [Tardiphaga sp. 71_E8_N1_1]|uniref:vWA domain-containing protein n=1 Tax=Tardiphaga sp. 71_E8_N1_1 TaxID=3240784 RepID=UPI003F8B3BA9